VFHTSYEAVDREFPELLDRVRPEVLIMFGLASRSRNLRIETRACNTRNLTMPDADGQFPRAGPIADDGPEFMPLRAPAQRLARAARETGVAATTSRDAGNYLCNYLCWRAGEAARRPGGPRLVTFVHVPPIGEAVEPGGRARKTAITMGALVKAGEAVLLAALTEARRDSTG
jgi:pyroglutamyl-peptidase